MKNLLHYGLQRSGTNFLESLILKNFKTNIINTDAERNHPLHKHFRLYDEKQLIPEIQYKNDLKFNEFFDFENSLKLSSSIDGIIIISKDPYSWYLSYRNWAKVCKWSKPNYNYIEEYNKFYGKWVEFSKQEEKIAFVKYSELLSNPSKELEKLENKFKLESRLRTNIFGRTLRIRRVSQSGRFLIKKKEHYLKKEYLRDIDKETFNSINSKINSQVMTDLKYKFEDFKTNT